MINKLSEIAVYKNGIEIEWLTEVESYEVKGGTVIITKGYKHGERDTEIFSCNAFDKITVVEIAEEQSTPDGELPF